MPLPYEEFNWRPNDNSAQTNLRYTLEAEKWVNAVSSAQRRAQPRSVSGDLAFISSLIQLVLCVLLLVVLLVLQLVKALTKFVETGIRNAAAARRRRRMSRNYIGELGQGTRPDAVWNFKKKRKKRSRYPRGWKLIFFTSWGRLRYFWEFLYLFVYIFIIEMIVLLFFNRHFPNYVDINRDVLIFAGVISFWNACQGVGEPY